jgi:integrating conjugative element membrane protein (TIGR03745 family)
MVIVQSLRKLGNQSIAMLALLAISLNAWPALPTPVAPSTGPAAGNWLDLIKGYIKDGGIVLGLAISVIGFLWVAYIGISKFNDARRGKAEWAEVGLVGIVGGAILLFAVFLLNEAANVI